MHVPVDQTGVSNSTRSWTHSSAMSGTRMQPMALSGATIVHYQIQLFLLHMLSYQSTKHMRILPSSTKLTTKTNVSEQQQPSSLSPPLPVAAAGCELSFGSEPSESETGFYHSPFPLVDSFIVSKLTKGGVQGSIRRWTYFPKGRCECSNMSSTYKSVNWSWLLHHIAR